VTSPLKSVNTSTDSERGDVRVTIESDPPDVQLVVKLASGSVVDRSPVKRLIPPGKYEVSTVAPEYDPKPTVIVVSDEAEQHFRIKLLGRCLGFCASIELPRGMQLSGARHFTLTAVDAKVSSDISSAYIETEDGIRLLDLKGVSSQGSIDGPKIVNLCTSSKEKKSCLTKCGGQGVDSATLTNEFTSVTLRYRCE
jgi:hypothetical protein